MIGSKEKAPETCDEVSKGLKEYKHHNYSTTLHLRQLVSPRILVRGRTDQEFLLLSLNLYPSDSRFPHNLAHAPVLESAVALLAAAY